MSRLKTSCLIALSVALAGLGASAWANHPVQVEAEFGQRVELAQFEHRPGRVISINEAARETAIRSCMRASFDHEKQACMQSVNRGGIVDPPAAAACGNMSFGHEIAPCLDAIRGKRYTQGEVQLCGNQSFSHQKIDCFKTAGRAPQAVPSYSSRRDWDGFILRSLRNIKIDIEQGHVRRALMEVAELIVIVDRHLERQR